MKRVLWILLLACTGLMTVSCQNGEKENTPEAATERFIKAYYTGDFAHQYEYTTKKSDIVIQQIQNGMQNNKELLEKIQKCDVAILDTKILEQTDSTATCACQFTINDEPRTDKWNLIKEEDLWKVTMVMP